MFQHLYDNPLLVTALPCVVALIVLIAAQWRRGFARGFGTVFAIGIAADAWLNGPWTPVRAGTALATAVGVFFVIFGDFRYFVLLEHALVEPHAGAQRGIGRTEDGKLALVRAAGWAFLVPVTSQLVRWASPRVAHDERSTFLLYELLFFGVAVGIWFFRLPRGTPAARLARRATLFEILQYAIWAGADVGLIKTGHDAFYALRIVANLLYYVAFVPTMLRWIPREKA
ncbi:MAG TPA: hypothetical protein VLM85_29620 [Polyangiaceae bacterium]|nr:hypothetical protein [Polyangiaceae bacterium]